MPPLAPHLCSAQLNRQSNCEATINKKKKNTKFAREDITAPLEVA
jgi:hypothetical protein